MLLLLAAVSGAVPVTKNDAFIFSDGHVEQVRSIKNDMVEWGGLSDRSYWRPRSPFLPITAWTTGSGEGRRTIIGKPQNMWPLGSGKSSRFTVITEVRRKGTQNWVRNVDQWDCKASALRQITVRAGAFDAARIACDRFSPTNMRLIERIEWDYVPELGHYARRTRVNYALADKQTIELVSALHGPAVSLPRLRALARDAKK